MDARASRVSGGTNHGKAVCARLTPGVSGLGAGEGTSSTAAEGESCSMSVSCGG